MKLSTILANYDEFQSSYKKIGFAQQTINIRDKKQFRLLLEKVISDIILFNDILNIYDYSDKDKKQILNWLNKLGYKREIFIQLLVEKNIDNLYEDESILEDEYNDIELFESEIQDEIENMKFFTESKIEDEIEDMTFITESNDLHNFLKQTVNWLLKYKLNRKFAENKKFVVKLIVKYFESANTIEGVFEQGECGYEACEGDFYLAEKEYYPIFIKAYNENKSKI